MSADILLTSVIFLRVLTEHEVVEHFKEPSDIW
jgi:hypothetical protein